MKFTDEGSVKIGVSLTEEGSRLCFSVKDTGIGLKDFDLKNIFEKYTQSRDVTYRKQTGNTRGTGLGLGISNMLVQVLGGKEILVSSTYREGSVFKFIVPFTKGTELVKATKINKKENQQLNLNVLIVEDIKANQMVGKLILTALGCKVLIADNGEEAIYAYKDKEAEIDLILMDDDKKLYGVTKRCP